MIDLAQRAEPYEFALPYSLTLAVKPLTTAGMAAAQAAARGGRGDRTQARERTEAGFSLDCYPTLGRGQRNGSYGRSVPELASASRTGTILSGAGQASQR